MVIHCPECNVGYNLTLEQIGDGRKLRCAKCNHEWFETGESLKQDTTPEEPTPTPAPEPPTEPTPDETTNENEEKVPLAPESDLGEDITKTSPLAAAREKLKDKMVLSVVGGVAGVLILFSTLMLAKNPLMKNFPVTVGFYHTLGLADKDGNPQITNTGLVIPPDSIEKIIEDNNGMSLLIFKGKVTNENSVEVVIPEIRVTLLDAKGMEIDHWPAQTVVSSLQPGETTEWICRFFNIPVETINEHHIEFVTDQ